MKNTITFKVKAPKRRVHKMLFDREFNFLNKRQDNKHAYKRKQKFSDKFDDYDY